MTSVFDVFAKLSLDSSEFDKGLEKAKDDTEGFGEKISGGLKSAAGTVAKITAAGIATAAGAVVSLTSQATQAYANYEQLVGGVETLFGTGGKSLEEYAASIGKSVDDARAAYENLGTAQEQLLKQARMAYKTAGLSANEYMEQATSFAASLVNSLKGDTVEAAKMADTAISDMSDNANKMGTSMDALQNAYNGFAKGNFTMLDNLKLGYGGTKTEMERLLAKAKELKKQQGIDKDYSIDNFADIVSAIHTVQEEMGIYGTTAKEAQSTISGSLSMTKSSWDNLVLAFSLGNDEISSALDDFINNAEVAFNNILPVAEKALKGIAAFIEQAIPILIERIPPLITELLPSFVNSVSTVVIGIAQALPTLITPVFDAVIQIVGVLAQALIDNAPAIMVSLGEVLTNIWTFLTENLPTATENGVAFLQSFAAGIVSDVPNLLVHITETMTAVFQQIMAAMPGIIQTGIDIASNLALGLLGNLPTIISSVEFMLGSMLGQLLNSLPDFLQKGYEFVQMMIDGIVANLPAIVAAIGSLISTLIQRIANNLPQILQKGVEIVKNLASGILRNLPALLSSAATLIAQLLASLLKALPKMLESGFKLAGEIASGLIKGIPKLLGAVPKLISSIWDGFKNTNWLSLGQGIINGIASGVTSMAQNLWSTVQNVAGGILNSIKGFFGIHSPSTVFRDQVGKMLALGMGEGFEDYIPTDDMVGSLKGALDEMASVDAPILRPEFDTASADPSLSGRGGITINIYGSEYQNPEDIARAVERELTRFENQRAFGIA